MGPDVDEGSSQMRDVAAYERRERQRGGQGFRPGGFGQRPGGPGRPQFGQRPGGFGPRPGGFGPRPGGFGQRPGGFGQRPSGPGPRPGAAGPRPGGFRPRGGGARYQDMVRRATSGPPTTPSEEAGEPLAGPHAVLEALRSERTIRHIYVAHERGARSGAMADVIREAQDKHVQIRTVDRLELDRLSPSADHQGVVAIAEGRHGVDLDELLLHLDTLTETPLVLVVDSLQDPQNFGVLLRSAEGAGVDGVVIPRHRQVGVTPAVARTSAGASEHLLIADVANLRQAIDALKEKGIWVVGTDDSGDMEWDEVDYRGPTAIVIGGEGEGIRRLVLEGCDQVVRIPMQGKVSSLNAAAAGTVVLFEAIRQRLRNAAPPTNVKRQERPAAAAVEAAEDALPEEEMTADTDEPVIEDAATAEELDQEGEIEPVELGTSGADEPAKPAPKRKSSGTKRTTRSKKGE